ncbi:ABC transporter permease [Promethearchaeum syntrophicum]|uniref:ABC transporter permease n=1 Tax=Promethearchaeum syntrophicum TaxID=2594042 RepID=A0A5B9DA83_9ARCH|nr:ABC transporter permease [Candidatus Prometheoarchaeum syntrophicum]QEE15757.1 D-ala-D-ala transporter subunit [Candidatus Prometheoarchaeum syntrophicum]
MSEITYAEIEKAESIDLEKELTFKNQFSELISPHYLKYQFKRNEIDETLKLRKFVLNKYKSKRSLLRRIKSPLTYVGIIILVAIVTFAVFAAWLSPYTVQELQGIDMSRSEYQPPDAQHILGTTEFGQDVFGRLMWGGRVSLTLGLGAIGISVVAGVIIGVFSAYTGGIIDSIIMRIADIIMAFPTLILLILLIASLGQQDISMIMWILGILSIPFYSRLVRSSVLQEKDKIYVEAALVSGAKPGRVMFRHILPNTMTPIIISLTFNLGTIILSFAALSFLGFGPSGVIEWGNDINTNRIKLMDAPWAAIWPGFMVMLAVLGFMLLGDGIVDALDPRSKA